MFSNLDEYHAKFVGNLVIQRLRKLASVLMNPCHLILLEYIIYMTHLNLNIVNEISFGSHSPLLQTLCLHLNLGN